MFDIGSFLNGVRVGGEIQHRQEMFMVRRKGRNGVNVGETVTLIPAKKARGVTVSGTAQAGVSVFRCVGGALPCLCVHPHRGVDGASPLQSELLERHSVRCV